MAGPYEHHEEDSGLPAPADPLYLRALSRPTTRRFSDDPLGRHVTRLLNLHANIAVKFREMDLAAMDEPTKRLLIEDIERVLQIDRSSTY